VLKSGPRGLLAVRRGIAALEFALVSPVLLTLVIGVFDIAKAIILQQEVLNTAHSVSLTASLLATQTLSTAGSTIPEDGGTETLNGTTMLTAAQVQGVESDIYAAIPWLRSGVEKGTFSVTLSGIAFSALPSGTCQPYSTCTGWVPFVAWSVPYKPAAGLPGTAVSLTRACGPISPSALLDINTSQNVPLTYSNFMTTLRIKSITYPDPILVADVSYTYSPAFLRFITGPVTFVASAYWPVRQVPYNSDSTPGSELNSGQLTIYDLANTDPSHHCTGYS
jgi:hypothetical protein